MANVLIVRAHPLNKEVSRSMAVTDAFVEEYKVAHPEDTVEDINLYNMVVPEIDRDLLNAWNELHQGKPFYTLSEAQQHKVTLFNSFTDSFLGQDKIVIANPLWNLSVPTRLKAWFDTINVAGKTFKYTATGSVGMMEGKKALHIQANGGIYSGTDPASQYVKLLLSFLGIHDVQQLFVEGLDQNPEKANAIVSEAMEKAREIARNF
ncbi:FMN-dependent NADH-azoreductase [Caldibacillus lycopersici]|uniref:FMN dependent NADH:quinone oxidoreductase n=1 Tax=Perspicuibacillus lycopersici TaxID=1325689 RepID=A0AAE3LMZ0_9BACI|nr:FMN-dependent NADH-azoreductase [Perspicuibacillus lycopersici]MCU9613421.1 FMN-dependent NADH-azoreductase [Perspicuibacillus lycopersici]